MINLNNLSNIPKFEENRESAQIKKRQSSQFWKILQFFSLSLLSRRQSQQKTHYKILAKFPLIRIQIIEKRSKFRICEIINKKKKLTPSGSNDNR